MTHPETGLVAIQEDLYHSIKAISKSGLDQISKSPAHYKAWLETPSEPTEAMLFGSWAHRLILEPELFAETCVVVPDSLIEGIRNKDGTPSKSPRSTAEYKARLEDWTKSQGGKRIIEADQYETLKGMAESWRKHPLYEGTHRGSAFEMGAFWKMDGLQCKARPDIIHQHGLILDLKTTDSAREPDFQRTISNFRYHVQAAWYLDGIARATGQKFDSFLFIAIEKKPPYAVAVYAATPSMIAKGRQTYMEDFETYRRCMEQGEWPSYSTDVRSIELPAWAI